MLHADHLGLAKSKPLLPVTYITSLTELSGMIERDCCPQNLYFTLRNDFILGRRETEIISETDKAPKRPRKRIKDDFDHLLCEVLDALAKVMIDRRVKAGLTIDVSHINLKVEHIAILIQALMSGQCPEYLCLRLYNSKLGDKGFMEKLHQALSSGRCPYGLQLDLRNNNFSLASIKMLADAIASGNCPPYLRLELQQNAIGDKGAAVLVNSLKHTRNKASIQLDIGSNRIKCAGAKAIAEAIEAGCWLPVHSLELSSNRIGNAGAVALAVAVMSRPCPQGFLLDISNNLIGDDGVLGVMKVLTSVPHPRDMRIDISMNPLTNHGAIHIADALNGGRCAQGLNVSFINEQIDMSWKPRMNSLMIKNVMRYNTVLRCLAFLQGSLQQESSVSRLPNEVLLLICAETYFSSKTVAVNESSQKRWFANRVFAFFMHLKTDNHVIPAKAEVSIKLL